jgi:RNase H-like domain found in reverse transcriptase/Reverse transcriptase (RNA-dependent DNA polymerase)/Integrase zinc binding domain/Integrase core domain/Chromo (CHRromatin Organisation MOdifier) domain
MIARSCFDKYFSGLAIVRKTPIPVQVSGVTGDTRMAEYAELELRLRRKDGRFILLKGEFHILPTIPCNILLANDILHTYYAVIDAGNERALFGTASHEVPVSIIKKETPQVAIPPFPVKKVARQPPRRRKIGVYATETTVVEPRKGLNVLIRHRPLPAGKSYLFTPIPIQDLATSRLGSAPKAVINDDPQAIPFANFGEQAIKVIKGRRMGHLEELRPEDMGPELIEDVHMVQVFLGETNLGDEQPFVLAKDRDEDFDVVQADISQHWGPEYADKMRKIVERHAYLFRPELGSFNDGIEMPIRFRDETDVLGLKSNSYGLSRRDRLEADKILDPLVEEGCVEPVPLGQPSAAASPAFIVWNKNKPRLVVDLRKVNTKLYPDAYPLPRQDDVLGALGGSTIFTSLDMQKSFFQQNICAQDRWKTAFVTPHRGQEQMRVAPMGLAVTPGFFQHRMEVLLKEFLWNFVLVYIDDIVIFSRTPEEHLGHVDQVLDKMQTSGVSLSVKKCHFGYPSIDLLGHHVSRLGYTTEAKKSEAIRNKKFPTTLQQLETGVGFFNYYRKYVDHFADIIAPLNQLKTMGFRNAPNKGRQRDRYASKTEVLQVPNQRGVSDAQRRNLIRDAKAAWEKLKDILSREPILAYPDYARPFKLYVDGSHEHGFGAAIHQVQDGVERPILFLSRCLKPSEKGYWATELETAALVWALQKVPFFFDSGDFEVVTDHAPIKGLCKEAKGRRSQRLDEWALFLSKYHPRMTVTHRAGKQHANADALSRLHDEEPIQEASATQADTEKLVEEPSVQTESFAVSIMGLDAEFIHKVRAGLKEDRTFAAVMHKLDAAEKAADQAGEVLENREWSYHGFRRGENGLLYHQKPGNEARLCVPANVEIELFRTAHDASAHAGLRRAYDKIHEVAFVPKLRKKLKGYVSGCPACQRAKPRNDKPYGELQPVPMPSQPFEVLAVDFVTGLPVAQDRDTFATVTCKYTKYVHIVPGKETWSAEEWASAFFREVFRYHNLPRAIVSDRDPRFTGKFWQALLRKCKIRSHMTAAYHPSADGQAERTNQSVEVALRCLLAGQYEEMWPELIPEIERSLNALRNASIDTSPFEALYGYSPNYRLTPSSDVQETQDFMDQRELVRRDLEDAIELANARMAIHFDNKHKPPHLRGKVFVKLVKAGRKGYQLPKSSKLSTIRMGPYEIKRRVGQLAYELNLPAHTRIHPVISCIHLEQCVEDAYQRPLPRPTPIIVDGQEEWVVEKLSKERGSGDKKEILVRWRGFDAEQSTWEPYDQVKRDVPAMFRAFESRTRRGRPRKD